MANTFLAGVKDAGVAVVTASLCSVLAVGPAMAEAPKPVAKKAAATQLTGQEKVLHALNRFTFGPRPGDVQAVEKMGLKKWFDQQLNPQGLDDAKLQVVLQNYPAMQLSQAELIRKFPPPQALRQMERTHAPMPTDPVEHAIYANARANYERQVAAAGLSPALIPKARVDADGVGQMIPAMDATLTPEMGISASSVVPDSMDAVRKYGGLRANTATVTRAEALEILYLPADQRMAKILAMTPEQVSAFRGAIPNNMRTKLFAGLSPEQVEVLTALQGPIRVVGAEALETRLLRDVYSERQLEAVMTDFWLNHFSVYVRKNQNQPYLLPAFERDTIRPHALGKFEDLLVATAESPAMMMYLDNWLSIGPNSPAAVRSQRVSQVAPKFQAAQLVPKGINENYARELMELHTLGVRCEVSEMHTQDMLDRSCGKGYTQTDVQNVAKVLTGWTIDRPYAGGGQGFTFDQRRHEGGAKQVLGEQIAAGGQNEGLQVLHMLATSPATAQFISHKLAVRFVSDAPPRELEDRMAKTFLATGGDMKAVLKTLFDSPEMWAPETYRAKVKTPIEFVASALRASDAQIENPLPLVQALERLGMPLYGRQTPDGYPWVSDEWVSTNSLVTRMNFALVMSGNLLIGTKANWSGLLGETALAETAPTPGTEAKLEHLLLGQPVTDHTRSTVLELGAKPEQTLTEASEKLGLRIPYSNLDSPMEAGLARGKGRRPYQPRPNASITELASNTGHDGPVPTMAGLLLGSPEFQRR